MRRRPALSVLLGIVVLSLVCCLVVQFVAIPRARDAFKTAMADAIATEIGAVIGSVDGKLTPGSYQIVAADLVEGLTTELNASGATDVQDLVFEITPEKVSIGFQTSGQSPVVSGRLEAVDGRLNVTDIVSSGGIFEFILPAETILGGLEQGFNQYLEQNGLTLASVEQGDGVLTIVVQ